ncbi:MAG: MFS transporter [Betaproteobacteria bacterium]
MKLTEELPKLGPMAIFLLGVIQILVWGGSFFLLAVLGGPVAAETGWSRQWIFGALSVSILVSGLLSPLCGRLIVRHGGRLLLGWSGMIIALGLVVLSMAGNFPVFLLAWVIIGIGMAGGLYDALFSTLGNIYGAKARSAITGITLISGFCATVVWPVLALGVEHLGWRHTCVAYAAVLVLLVWPIYIKALPGTNSERVVSKARIDKVAHIDGRLYALMACIFTLAAVFLTAMSVYLLTLLQWQGYSLAVAVGLSALIGPSQVGSRVVNILSGDIHPMWPTLVSVLAVAAGLLLMALWPALAGVGIVLYGAGNGLRAIVRGTLPLALLRPEDYAVVMGRIARPALIGQALTPLVGGYLIDTLGEGFLLSVLCGLALLNVVFAVMLVRYLRGRS